MPPGAWTTEPGDDDAMQVSGAAMDTLKHALHERGRGLKAAMIVVVLDNDEMATCIPAGQSPLLTLDLAVNVLEGGGAKVIPVMKPVGEG